MTAPANDNFASALVLSGTSTTGNNSDATGEVGEPDKTYHSVWFTWTAPAPISSQIDTEGSDFDTYLYIYTGTTLTGLTRVAFDDDSGIGVTSKIIFTPTSGVTYYIKITGFNSGSVGNYVLRYPDPNGVFITVGATLTVDASISADAYTVPYSRIYSSLTVDASISADAYTVHNKTARAALNTEVTISADLAIKPYPRASLTVNTTFLSDGEDNTVVRVSATARNLVSIYVSSRAFMAIPYIPAFRDINQIRTLMSVKLTFPDPAIINGKPYSPDYWSHLEGSYTATANNGSTITVVPDPVIPPFEPGDDRPPGQIQYTWKASDLRNTSKLAKWPVHSGSGPSWASSRGYEPSVGSRITFSTKDGKQYTQDKGVLFDYHNVEHMWLRLPTAKSDDFTWMICGIILSYPTVKYGHYVLDHGWNTKTVKPLPSTEGKSKKLGESGYRAAMLYQRHSALMGSHTGEDLAGDGKHVRIQNNYLPKPRVMYSIWNNGAGNNRGTIGSIGRGYHKSETGTIDSKTMQDFVIGRRFNKISKDLASHMVIFEIRYFPRALGKKEIRRQANNLASLYKFGKY